MDRLQVVRPALAPANRFGQMDFTMEIANSQHNSAFEVNMSAEAKKGYGSTAALIAFGLMALYFGVHWLLVLIPAAVLVWYGARPALRSGRN